MGERTEVSFADASHLWVCGRCGRVLRTTEGGRTRSIRFRREDTIPEAVSFNDYRSI